MQAGIFVPNINKFLTLDLARSDRWQSNETGGMERLITCRDAETNQQLLNHFRVPGRFVGGASLKENRLVAIAYVEQPSVRALLGAIGQELKYSNLDYKFNGTSTFFGTQIASKH